MIDIGLQAIAIALILYVLYKWITINNNHFKKLGIPYLKPYFFFGNTGGLVLGRCSNYDFHLYVYNSFTTEKIVGLFDFRQPFLYLRDAEIINQLAVKDFDYFQDHRLFFENRLDRLFGNSLLMLEGKKWRDMRATLSPAFTGSKMRQMFDLVVECSEEMSKYLYNNINSDGGKIQYEMKDLFSRYTNDLIASTAFGVKVNSFENPQNEFWKTGNNLINFSSSKFIKLFFLKMTPWLMKSLDIEFIDKKDSSFIREMVTNTIKTRQHEAIFRPDMINILMQLKTGTINMQDQQEDKNSEEGFAIVQESSIGKKIVKRKWEDDELIAQCFIFFAAGFETTSTVLSFLTYEIALNPNIQEKLYAEIKETHKLLNGKKLQYDVLQKMKYMDMVISETLRIWTPIGATDRVCVQNYLYDDGNLHIEIKKDTIILIPVYAIHQDPKYFPNPKLFNPDRFNDENKVTIKNGSYLPFGIGPRSCIGSRFALMEAKAILYYLLLSFKFETNVNTQIPVKLANSAFATKSEKGIFLNLVARSA